MAAYQKKSNNRPDPLYAFMDAMFKGLWRLATWPFRDKAKVATKERAKAEFRSHFLAIENQLQAGHLKEAIMNADILLDKALRAEGWRGTSLGERLKAAGGIWNKELLDAAWRAHKVRNRLAHELRYEIANTEARQAVADFKKVVKSLGFL